MPFLPVATAFPPHKHHTPVSLHALFDVCNPRARKHLEKHSINTTHRSVIRALFLTHRIVDSLNPCGTDRAMVKCTKASRSLMNANRVYSY